MITDKIIDLAKEWHNRPLERIYPILFFDAIHYKVTSEGKVANYKYPEEIRKMIYTTNAVEALHRQFRKVTKAKSIYPNDDALKKMDKPSPKLDIGNITTDSIQKY